MIVVKLMGGLGNQMFQYAFGRSVAIRMQEELFLDASFFEKQVAEDGFTPRNFELSVFQFKAKIASDQNLALFNNKSKKNTLRKKVGLPYYKTYQENGVLFDNKVLNQKVPVCFSGYWQSEKYFNSIAETIRKELEFKIPLDEQTSLIAAEIRNCNAVSIHFRRGDYVTSKITNNYHGICSLDYYLQAKEKLEKANTHNTYFIFSDDIEWVKANFLGHRENAVYVKNSFAAASWKDLYLMSLCKHNIIANSSFSWWGAWLNENPDKIVIAPKRWFANNSINDQTADLIPQSWQRI
jgi:hypothetical protein